MDIKKASKRVGFSTLLFVFTLLNPAISIAAGGSILVVPEEGSFANGEQFQARVRVEGGGAQFNAAKATVNVTDNLKVEGVTLGDCGFAFVDTPSTSSLSFAGVILGDSSTSCTAYSIALRVNGSDSGQIMLTDGSIKSYDGANEILENLVNSSYTFSPGEANYLVSSVVTPTQQPLVSSNGEKMYTLIYSIPNSNSSDGKNLTVILDANLPTQMTVTVSPLSADPTVLAAIFENVPGGVHTIDVIDGSQNVSSEIVNLEGESREISLGVMPRSTGNSLVMIALIAVGIITFISALILGYVFYKRKTATNQ